MLQGPSSTSSFLITINRLTTALPRQIAGSSQKAQLAIKALATTQVMEDHNRYPSPQVSKRIQATDDPIMVQSIRMVGDAKDVLSLGQGAVYWGPCEQAVREAADHAMEPEFYSYGYDHGIAPLREALLKKIQEKNGLHGYNVTVTAGANQALASLMITLLDPDDRSVLFRPYYFNALMAVQMMGGGQSVLLGPSNPETLHPDLDWLEQQLKGPQRPKLVYLVNPCNPTGVTLSKAELQRLADMTAAASAWLVIDNTYEAFLFSGAQHHTINAPNIIHVFSFSKGHGLMGWRVGYIAYPDHDGSDFLGLQLIKVQDTIPIHSAIMSQKVALGTLRYGEQYTEDKIATLQANRQAALKALEPLGTLGDGVWGGDAIYLFARLPEGCKEDTAIIKWLAHKHGVAVIPGSACGYPGHIRVAFGKPEVGANFEKAAARLRAGLEELVQKGPSVAKL